MSVRGGILQVILKVQSPIPRLDLPCILHLSTRNPLLQLPARSNVPHLCQDNDLAQAYCTERKGVAQSVWRTAVDLTGDNASTVADGLLEADGCGSTVVWSDVDVEPGEVETWSGVDCHGAEECGEEADADGDVAEEEDVADDSEEIGEDEELES